MTSSRGPKTLSPGPFPASAAARRLVAWFRRHRRRLPWRQTSDPYRIWVSEVMLQQTQVATVIPYYRRFVRRFPRLEALAAARAEEVLAAWSGLGYYRRARDLHAAAKEVVSRFGGRIPAAATLLRSLPGVGRYTAGAVASIAFDLPEPAVDGNVLRVVSRLLALRGDPRAPGALRRIEAACRALLKEGSPGEVNQGLMELGALVCSPPAPRCSRCPLAAICRARAAGLQSVLPEISPRRRTVALEAAVALVRRGRAYLMVRREEDLMRDLWEFPGTVLEPGEEARRALVRIGRERLGASLRVGERLASLRQSLTYRRVTVGAYSATLREPSPGAGGRGETRWVCPEDLPGLPHHSLTRRILERIAPRAPARPGTASSRHDP